ncbi:thymosin beta-4 isoform X1 [Strigops habroptila]|uniref:thymosin beta-4 isoform X1 n=1 Tax=Strigops habroptila TaxID=2489341 RepID=UPI0011D01C1E|nr:thymosin beta-4 isoform X1 [Strigops habroptila]
MGFFSPCSEERGGRGRGETGRSRSSEGTRVSSFLSECGNLSNGISEQILLNRERGTPRAEAKPPPAPAEHSPPPPLRKVPGSAPVPLPSHQRRGRGDRGARGSARSRVALPPPDCPVGASRRPGPGWGPEPEPEAGAGIKPPRQRAPFIPACGAAAVASGGAEHHRAATSSHLPTCPTNQTWPRSRNLTSPN